MTKHQIQANSTRLVRLAHVMPLIVGLFGIVFAQSAFTQPTSLDNFGYEIAPLTRAIEIQYRMPEDAPNEVRVLCHWSPAGEEAWQPAAITPGISETAANMARPERRDRWSQGVVIEQRAAGLDRTITFDPFPEAEEDGLVDIDFRVRIQDKDSGSLYESTAHVQADNTDVVLIEDWANVQQQDAVEEQLFIGTAPNTWPEGRKWAFRTGMEDSAGVLNGDALYGKRYDPEVPLPELSYHLDLKGWYALYHESAPGGGGIEMRLSGDEYYGFANNGAVRRMDYQHLVFRQPDDYTGYVPASLDYVRLIPVPEDVAKAHNAPPPEDSESIFGGYFEPYSWSFANHVSRNTQHREPMYKFKKRGVNALSIQIGRFGMKVVYESRLTDTLIYDTIGDPVPGDERPRTYNVGRMQQYTNTLQSELKYAKEMGIDVFVNFGASNCYPGSPLQGDFSKEHPEWMRGARLRYEVPQVREYALSLIRESLELGAPAISIDFTRYPATIDKPETCNLFLRELRAVTDEFSEKRGEPVPVHIIFPAIGVRLHENFDFHAWIEEDLVDYLSPGAIQGRHYTYDITPYIEAVEGTEVKLAPYLRTWGFPMPGLPMMRVRNLYEAGVDGVFMENFSQPFTREGVEAFWKEDAETRPGHTKGIYISAPFRYGKYQPYQRLRVWLEGIEFGPVEMFLDGKLVQRCEGPPYVLGSEDYEDDDLIPEGSHELRIRAKDGDGWIEQTFTIEGA